MRAARLRAAWRGALFISCVAAFSPATSAQIVTSTDRGIVLARDHRIELAGAWKSEGVAHPTGVIAGRDRVAVLDALNNEAVIADLATGRARRIRTAETPIDAAFVGDELYILARDARLLQHVGGRDVPLQADFLEAEGGNLYAYSRLTGALHQIGGRTIQVAPFASDFEIDGGTAYLAFPREGRIRTVDLATGAIGEIAVGAVPVDLAFAGGGTAISARILAVADPSARRVWMAESTQSTAAAIARGFLRGFFGLGLFAGRGSKFPTGVDRVETRGKTWIAYDSSSRTLYHFTNRRSTVVARNVAPLAFALTGDGVAWWNGTSVAEKRLR